MTFHVGQKVCCIQSREWESIFGTTGRKEEPVYGGVYEISRIHQYQELAWLILTEFGERVGYEAQYFRPVVERKTDISVFTRMLTDNTVDA